MKQVDGCMDCCKRERCNLRWKKPSPVYAEPGLIGSAQIGFYERPRFEAQFRFKFRRPVVTSDCLTQFRMQAAEERRGIAAFVCAAVFV